MEKELEKILATYELRKTPLRFKILSVLKAAEYALSQPEIENKIEEDLDRITVYRTLKSFEEKGIIHRVFDIWGTAKFAFSLTDDAHHTSKEHLHFNCTNCKHVFCLSSYSLPSLNFPTGFKPAQINLSAEGICKECAALKH
ncbi:MAG: transcriptional repressor [Chryseobacterium sp.]|nr:MAG: transcriptional repressor [Chryseobacterium sp.]